MSKYGNRRTVVDGRSFASAKEAQRYVELRAMEQNGALRGLQCQVRFPLTVNGEKICVYIADFVYETASGRVVEDVKGAITPVYSLKKRLMKACLGIDIRETR